MIHPLPNNSYVEDMASIYVFPFTNVILSVSSIIIWLLDRIVEQRCKKNSA